MLPPPVVHYLHAHRQQHLEQLFELLRLPSIANITTDDDPCLKTAHWLRDYLTGLGLDVRIWPVEGGKPNVLAQRHLADDKPTVLIYGHYDVQPPEPLEPWQSPPFEPTIRDGFIYARGASDDKGQMFANLMAVEAWLRAGQLPVNLKIFLEGEEEIGSPRMETFLAEHGELLQADIAIISDSAFFAPGLPSITYALRGLAYVEITLQGPSADLHSGIHGGAVANPINALARLVAQMHDAHGRVTLPGFYDDVAPLSDQERQMWAALPFDEQAYAQSLGLNNLAGGEEGYSVLERVWARPTLDCCGICGGYTAQGAKTIIPAQARAKISMRLVPNQDPAKIIESVRRFVAAHLGKAFTANVEVFTEARPVLLGLHSPAMDAARSACEEAFGQTAAMIRCGASVPITEMFQRRLGLDAVLLGYGLPDDALHSPNERFSLEQFYRGAIATAAFLGNLADAKPKNCP